VTIILEGLNDAPVAADVPLNVYPATSATPFKPIAPQFTEITIKLRDYVSDIDDLSEVFTVQIIAGTVPDSETEAEISLDADRLSSTFGEVTFKGVVGFHGNVTFDYMVTDNEGADSNVATVSVEVNDAPVAVDDFSSSSPIEVYQDVTNHSTVIDVLANDTDVDGTLDPNSVEVLSVNPLHGTIVGILSDGSVDFKPFQDPVTGVAFLGETSFEYTVKDDDGAISDPATVFINVIPDPYPWRNRSNALDVNRDEFVSAIDALLIINELNLNGSYTLPTPYTGNGPPNPNFPPPYYDAGHDGACQPAPDNYISGADALAVINYLSDRWCYPVGGEGEFSISVDMTQSIASESLVGESVVGESVVGPAAQVLESKVVDNGFTDMRNMRSSGLSTVRGEVLEDLLGEIAEDLTDAQEDGLLVDLALNDFFG
jgi:hypothetical protein